MPRFLTDPALSFLLALLTWSANRISLDRVGAVGAALGRAWANWGAPRVERVESQLRAAFPEASPSTIEDWTRAVFEHYGRSLAEVIALRGRHRVALLDHVEIEGLEHLRDAEALTESGGVLVATAHYGNWELAGIRMAREGESLAAVFRGIDNAVLDAALLEVRTRDVAETGGYEQLRRGHAGVGVVRAFSAGRKVFVLLDQNARNDESAEVRFFGRPAQVRRGAVRLAVERGVPIVPARIRRDARTGEHEIRIEQALRADATGGEAEEDRLLAELMARIEAWVREDPTQWIWAHRLWH